MAEKENIMHAHLVKRGGKLIHVKPSAATQYDEYVKNLEEGQQVDFFMDANVDDGTLAQLAKVHACIKALAKEIGNTFEDQKIDVKRAAGLCVKKEINGDMYMICKSFSKCSKDELSLAIQALIQMGDAVNINFR